MSKAEQQARELAEECGNAIARDILDGKKIKADTILSELNLVALLEDKARLDWLDSSYIADDCHRLNRTAITNAMREQEEEK